MAELGDKPDAGRRLPWCRRAYAVDKSVDSLWRDAGLRCCAMVVPGTGS